MKSEQIKFRKTINLVWCFLIVSGVISGCATNSGLQSNGNRYDFLDEEITADELILLSKLQSPTELNRPADYGIELSPCREYSGRPSLLYRLFREDFINDKTEYRNVIRGDSSMHISSLYTDFLSPDTQSVAVAGNTLCDMLEQVPAINSAAPAAIIVGTAGGNDLQLGIPAVQIIQTARMLIEQIRTKWPAAKIVMVSVHPTLNDFPEKTYTNNGIKSYLSGIPNSCWIDTYKIFGKSDGELADPSQMLDEIHYNQTYSFLIKDAIIKQCGVAW